MLGAKAFWVLRTHGLVPSAMGCPTPGLSQLTWAYPIQGLSHSKWLVPLLAYAQRRVQHGGSPGTLEERRSTNYIFGSR